MKFCSNDVTDDGILQLLDERPKSHLLDLSGCHKISDACLFWIPQGCSLQELYLIASDGNTGTNGIFDKGVCSIADTSPNLLKLDLSENNEITDMSIICISQGYRKLISVNLSSETKEDHGPKHRKCGRALSKP